MGWNSPLVNLCPGCVLSQPLAFPQPTHWEQGVGDRKDLDAVQELFSNSQNSGVLTLF